MDEVKLIFLSPFFLFLFQFKSFTFQDHVTLSEEERDKRDKRRLRNKEAAARCRQRRLDLMGSLQNVRSMNFKMEENNPPIVF